MPAVERPIRLVFKPTGEGRGGMFTNTNPIEADPTFLSNVQNFYIDGGKWQGIQAPTVIRFALTAAPTSIQTAGSGAIAVIFSTNFLHIINQSGSILLATGFTSPGNIETVRQRIYASNGIANGIFDPSVAPTILIQWGCAPQTPQLTYTINNNTYTTGTITTNGTTLVVGSGGGFTASMVGKAIYILGQRFIIGSFTNGTNINTTTVTGNNGVVPNGSWQINQNVISWNAGNGLRYAVSYYNSISGHTSNLSPIISIDDGNPLNDNASITIGNILHNSTFFGNGFNQIIVWRSGHGGGSLFPRATIPNAADNAATTYVDGALTNDPNEILPLLPPLSANSDQILGQVIGQFVGPITDNTPPPSDLNFATYWDGRMWGWSASKNAIVYSHKQDLNEFGVGIAEESFPPSYTVTLPQSDFAVTGMKVVANTLMVSGGFGIYRMVGTSPGFYVLGNLTSKGAGSAYYAMDRLPGEDTNSSDILVHEGNDRRLYFLYGQGGDVSYSYPIQDKVKASPTGAARVKVIHQPSSPYILFGSTTATTQTMVFDVERKVWFLHQFDYNGGFCEVKDTTTLAMRPVGSVFTSGQWNLVFIDILGSAIAAPLVGKPYILTSIVGFSPPGVPRNVIKRLQEVHVFTVNNNTDIPTFQVQTFGGSSLGLTSLTRISATSDLVFRNVEPGELVFVPPSGTQIDGLTFSWTCTWATPSNPPDCSQIELIFTVEAEDSAVNGQV